MSLFRYFPRGKHFAGELVILLFAQSRSVLRFYEIEMEHLENAHLKSVAYFNRATEFPTISLVELFNIFVFA